MTALIKARFGSIRKISRDKRPLAANAKVFKGGIAVCYIAGATSKGFYRQGLTSPDLKIVGRFTEDVDNTGGADGLRSAEIQFFYEREVQLFETATAADAIAASEREGLCYAMDDQTLTKTAAGRSAYGRVYDVTSEGVWAEGGAS